MIHDRDPSTSVQAGNIKKADKIFKAGLEKVGEDHREELRRKHNNFQVSNSLSC